jgi:hypothetical protein
LVNRKDCGKALLLLSLLGAVAPLAACAGAPPRRPNVMHPVHERRALEILSRVLREGQLQPEAGHAIMLPTKGAVLQLDVAAAGHRFGVAYVTREEVLALGDAIPRFDPESDALILVDGLENGAGWHALLLYDKSYLSDDLEGEGHSVTNIAAEKKIERDAKDFLVKAQHEQW